MHRDLHVTGRKGTLKFATFATSTSTSTIPALENSLVMGARRIFILIVILLFSLSAMARSYRCAFCGKSPPTLQGLSSHLSQKASCRIAMRERLARKTQPEEMEEGASSNSPPTIDDEPEDEMDMVIDYEPPIDDQASPMASTPPLDRRARVDDVDEDEDDDDGCKRWIEDFPKPAGVPIRRAKSYFETVRDDQKKHGEEPWAPFQDMEEWELGQFLMLNLGQNATDKFLKLPIVRLFIFEPRSQRLIRRSDT